MFVWFKTFCVCLQSDLKISGAFVFMSFDPKIVLHGVACGDHKAFERLYNLYFGKCYSFALFFTHSEDLAEEVVSEVFLTVWKRRERLPDIKDWESYLYISVRNQSVALLKKFRGRLGANPAELFSIEIESDCENPEDKLVNEELEMIVQRAYGQLPERCGMIYYLVKSEGFSYKQVAEIMGISERTVNSQMTIAIKRLGTMLRSYLSSE